MTITGLTIKSGGIIATPAQAGAELYLWAYSYGNKPAEYIFNDQAFRDIAGVPLIQDGVIATNK